MKILYAIFNKTFLLSTHLINLKYYPPPRERERERERETDSEREKKERLRER